jgi:predicted transcriptional regulator
MDDSLPELGDLEHEVMQLVWANGPITAEAVRERLSRSLKESTVRTVLRRLEDKGYTTHTVDGRTYVYQAAEPRGRLESRPAHRRRFCKRLNRRVLVGAVDTAMSTNVSCARLLTRLRRQGEREEIMLAILAGRRFTLPASPLLARIGRNLRHGSSHMTCWAMVLVASLSCPSDALDHDQITVDALPVPAAEHCGPQKS